MGVDVWHLGGGAVDPGASRELLRRVLSRYAPVAPEAWRFGTGSHGRPEIVEPACGLRFSVAHTAGMIVIAVCDGDEIGVDVERLDRRPPAAGFAERWFAPEEVAALRAAAEPVRGRRFLELWTLKEAYVKARGLGVIGLPLDSFVVDPAGPTLCSARDDDHARWRLTLVVLGAHLVAVATTASAEPVFRDAA